MSFKIGADIKAEHQTLGAAKRRLARKVHKSTSTLLAVPRYADLLVDQDDEDDSERGRMLVNSRQGWRTEMAKWISDARDAEAAEDEDDEDNTILPLPASTGRRSFQWKSTPLAILFGGSLKNHPSRLPPTGTAAEEALMQALAELEEEDRLDDGAIEIASEDEFMP